MGLGVQLYVNAVRKLPLMRNPWEHAIWAGAGAAFGTWIVSFEKETEKELTGQINTVNVLQVSQFQDKIQLRKPHRAPLSPVMQNC